MADMRCVDQGNPKHSTGKQRDIIVRQILCCNTCYAIGRCLYEMWAYPDADERKE